MSHNCSQLRSSDDVAPHATQATDDLDTVVADGLTQRQLNALDLLISGLTITAAAKAIGVCRRTLTRWKNEVEPFKAELRRRREDLIDEHGDRLRAMVGKALDVMDEHLESRWAPTCHRAARTILSLTALGKSIGIKPNAKQTRDESPASETPVTSTPPAPNGAPEPKPMSLSTAKALLKAVNAVNLYGGFTGASPRGGSGPLPLAG